MQCISVLFLLFSVFVFVCLCGFFFNFYPSEATENYYYNEYWSFTDFVTNNSSKHLHIQLEPMILGFRLIKFRHLLSYFLRTCLILSGWIGSLKYNIWWAFIYWPIFSLMMFLSNPLALVRAKTFLSLSKENKMLPKQVSTFATCGFTNATSFFYFTKWQPTFHSWLPTWPPR